MVDLVEVWNYNSARKLILLWLNLSIELQCLYKLSDAQIYNAGAQSHRWAFKATQQTNSLLLDARRPTRSR